MALKVAMCCEICFDLMHFGTVSTLNGINFVGHTKLNHFYKHCNAEADGFRELRSLNNCMLSTKFIRPGVTYMRQFYFTNRFFTCALP